MTVRPDFNTHIGDESERFAAAIGHAQADARVPTCPDWDASDLLWHLGEVQNFWATTVRERLTETAKVREIDPPRPAAREQLLEFFHQAGRELLAALADVDDETEVWTWSEQDHSAGFIRRRQAHEALIHRVDAEETAGRRTPMDPALCADGVDEVLKVMYGGAPPWGTFEPDGRSVLLHAVDVDLSWPVALGRFSGLDPDKNEAVDETDIRVRASSSEPVNARISGTAANLDCWLWHRPMVGELARSGDPDALDALTAVLSQSID